MEKQIIDLLGNKFLAKAKFKLCLSCPKYRKANYTYTRDRISGKLFTLIHLYEWDKWLMVSWSRNMNLYIVRDLKFQEYEEKFDIRYEWKYKKELKKFYESIKKTA